MDPILIYLYRRLNENVTHYPISTFQTISYMLHYDPVLRTVSMQASFISRQYAMQQKVPKSELEILINLLKSLPPA